MESLVGKVIDNYRILDILGKGGMGIVYKAIDINLEKTVALKMMDPVFSHDPNFLKRFRSEARALARVENPHIVNVFALRETEYGIFIVMEYVDGTNFSQILQERGTIPWKEALPVFEQILTAIGFAHQSGVIHRDIKPSNIMLSNTSLVKVTDFGLAKVKQHGQESTVTEMKAGTLYYMSPEQVRGLRNVDQRSDIYSIGMTFYELLLGWVPFRKTDSDFTILKAIVEENFTPPSKVDGRIPKGLSAIIMKSIEKDPGKRYQNAGEMVAALKKFENKVLPTGEVTQESQSSTPFKKGFLAASAVLIVVAILFWITSKPDTKAVTKANFLTIHSQPENAVVYLDQDSIGRTPLNKFPVKEGNLHIRLEHSAYRPLDTLVAAKSGEINDLLLTLNPLEETSSASHSEFAQVQVNSNPPGAEFWLNGRFAGTTPFKTDQEKPGIYQVVIKKKNYAEYRESLELKSGRAATVNAELSQIGRVSVMSTPSGASVFLKGKKIGNTPLNRYPLLTGKYQMEIRKDGFKPFTSALVVDFAKDKTIDETLSALQGKLAVLVRPYGSIYIDGHLKKKDTPVQFEMQLPAGTHQLRVEHSRLGAKWEDQVDIEADKEKRINVDFNRMVTLTVASTPTWANIIVDGKPSGQVTPKELDLRIGLHTISVKRDGFVAEGGEKRINLESDLSNPLIFTLRKAD